VRASEILRENESLRQDPARREGFPARFSEIRGFSARASEIWRENATSGEIHREREFTEKLGEKRGSSGEIRGFPTRESEIQRKNARSVEKGEIPARRREREREKVLNFVFYFWSVLL
jgi:hypothetical protein